MTRQQQETHIEEVVIKLKETLLKKGNDYANEDRLSNFKLAGAICGLKPEVNCLSLIATKVARLGVLLNSDNTPNNESIQDSILDLQGYTMLLSMLMQKPSGLVVNKNMSKEEFKKGYEYWLEKLFGTKIRLVDRTKETDNYMRKYKQAHPIKEEDAIDLEETFEITPNLRYVEKLIPIDDKIGKRELRLQQMWQGSDGTQKWEWIEISR